MGIGDWGLGIGDWGLGIGPVLVLIGYQQRAWVAPARIVLPHPADYARPVVEPAVEDLLGVVVEADGPVLPVPAPLAADVDVRLQASGMHVVHEDARAFSVPEAHAEL